jgi:uncharacterized protein YndB with AHSA1/START domain
MEQSQLEIKAGIGILKPAHEVFEAIVDPVHMSQYFISKSTGRMEEGSTLNWSFPEFEGAFPVRVGAVRPDEYVSFHWASEDGHELLVEITLTPGANNSTVVTVTEKGMPNNEAGLAWLKGNTEGWANFLACLKAYVEYGINLRKGAFDYRFTAS